MYTRYADDLTFSRDGKFPKALGYWDKDALPIRESRIGKLLNAAVTTNGFEAQLDKVHLRFHDERQVVTGLIVNRKVNVRRIFVRRIRAMLHAWATYGEEAAEQEFFQRYDTKDRAPHATRSFRRVVKGHIDYLGMIRGTDHRWYQELIDEYARLVPTYVARPPRHRRPAHLRTWKDAIWVIETDEGQGTAFELESYGFITCAHVVRDTSARADGWYPNSRIYSPRNQAVCYPIRVVAYDRDIDLAILECEAGSGSALKARAAPLPQVGDLIRAAGYPRHSTGSHLWEETGRVTHMRQHMKHPRYMVTIAIVAGASGSPVMDTEGRVVGVAATGAPSFGATTVHKSGHSELPGYGVIPIAELDIIRERSG